MVKFVIKHSDMYAQNKLASDSRAHPIILLQILENLIKGSRYKKSRVGMCLFGEGGGKRGGRENEGRV